MTSVRLLTPPVAGSITIIDRRKSAIEALRPLKPPTSAPLAALRLLQLE